MAELDELDLTIEEDRNTKRFNDLSNKVKETAKERDEAKALLEQERLEKQNLAKEKDFYASFSDSISEFPDAAAFKDKIKEKAMTGYSTKDATIAVLHAEGKLNTTAPKVDRESPAGGSAANQITGAPSKAINEMTRDEKRAALMEREKEGGISVQ